MKQLIPFKNTHQLKYTTIFHLFKFLLLKLLCLNQAWTHFQQRTVEELFDPNLMLHNYHNSDIKHEISRVVHVGLLCTQEIPSLRPFMPKALLMLVGKERLPAPTNPPFMDEKTMEFNDMSSDTPVLNHGNEVSVANISHSIFYPR